MSIYANAEKARDSMLRSKSDDRRKSEVFYARQIQAQTNCAWGEALRVATARIEKESR